MEAAIEAFAEGKGAEGASSRALRLLIEEVKGVGDMVQEVGGRTIALTDTEWPAWEARVAATRQLEELFDLLLQA